MTDDVIRQFLAIYARLNSLVDDARALPLPQFVAGTTSALALFSPTSEAHRKLQHSQVLASSLSALIEADTESRRALSLPLPDSSSKPL